MKVKKRPRKKPLDLDITSLLDILVILLVFLLRNYNASDLQLEVAKGVELANSGSPRLGQRAIIVQIDQHRNLYLDNKKLFTINDQGSEIPLLLAELKKRGDQSRNIASTIKASSSSSEKDDPKKKRNPINLVFDKRLPFQLVQKVLHTASLAGHNQYKLIVQGNVQ